MKPIIFFLLLFSVSFSADAQWSKIARGLFVPLAVDDTGNIYAATDWDAFGTQTPGNYVGKWNGNSWVSLGFPFYTSGDNDCGQMCFDSSHNIYLGGEFTNSNGKKYVAKFDGVNWSEVGGTNGINANGFIYATCFDKAGNLYAAGDFTNTSGNQYVAKWDGISWSELGTGSGSLNANGTIYTMCIDTAGNLYIAGEFTNSSGNYYVAKWNGAGWTELGGNNSLAANGPTGFICIDPFSNIYTGYTFTDANNKCYVAKWNGSNWSRLGNVADTALFGEEVHGLCADAKGNIYAGHYKRRYSNATSQGNHYVIKWDGVSWTEMGGTNGLNAGNEVLNITTDALGNLYVNIDYDTPYGSGYIAKYTGAFDARFFTAQNGTWSNPDTWAGGIVPPKGAVTIVRHQVIVDKNTSCYSVSVQAGGNITVASGIQFNVLH